MITSIALKLGPGGGSSPLKFEPTHVTVFVGPNNSGKSLLLREIQKFFTEGYSPARKILNMISFRALSKAEADDEIARMAVPTLPNEEIPPENVMIAHSVSRKQVHRQNLQNALVDPAGNLQSFITEYFRYRAMSLDGQSRLSLANDGAGINFLRPPSSLLDLLLRQDERRKEFRRIVFEAFGQFIAIDPTQPGTLKLKLADREPTEDEERSFKEVAVKFHERATPLAEYSDGVRAFVGILLMVVAGSPTALTLDEPEAFLHPSLTFKLAKEISGILAKSNRHLFVATHSADFVMGCVAAGSSVNVVRLTHTPQESTARILSHTDMRSLMRRPMLRSAGALRALFYLSVVVTEADADRAFYAEMNERLLTFNPSWGAANCLFLNANGKDTVADIVVPLRALGIPAAAIVDLDVVEQGGANWAKFMDACSVPEIERSALELTRSKVRAALHAVDKDYNRKGGIDVLDKPGREAASNFIERLAEYGLFVVPRGQVEHWLSALSLNRSKRTWLHEVFEKIGDAPDEPGYIKPGDDDVWRFVWDVKRWLTNPNRKGIPR